MRGKFISWKMTYRRSGWERPFSPAKQWHRNSGQFRELCEEKFVGNDGSNNRPLIRAQRAGRMIEGRIAHNLTNGLISATRRPKLEII